MIRSGLAFGILLAVSGCGVMAYAPDAPEAEACAAVAAPDCVRVPEAALGFSRLGGGRGYVWLGYTAADVGQEDLNKLGRGDGFGVGAGFRLSDAGRTSIEFALEKTLKHAVDPAITTDSQAYHERRLLGLRTTTAARARMQNQPRPYVSYGIAYNHVEVKYEVGAAVQDYHVNGQGYYAGLGCEFPTEGRGAFSFDMKFHSWEDEKGQEGTYGALTFALFWMSRF